MRALLDLAPNAWLVWEWVDVVVRRFLGNGVAEVVLASSTASLVERLRADVERERDRLAELVFEREVAAGRIRFALQADATDYELPMEAAVELPAKGAPPLMREDHRPVEKSLLEPAVRTPDMNEFEAAFAGYLDGKQALQWWHRNVAKSQYGLQGWKRHKIYPDFVFAYGTKGGKRRTVLLETKGLHLKGADDTTYKQALLQRLTEAFRDERHVLAGELVLAGTDSAELVCDLLFEEAAWRSTMESRVFSG